MQFRRLIVLLTGLLPLTLNACTSHPVVSPAATSSIAVELTPTSSATVPLSLSADQVPTCADLAAPWAANDWPKVLIILHRLQQANQKCGLETLGAKEYAAHINYATALEADDQRAEAVQQYLAALALNSRGREALSALARLKALPTLPAPPCHPGNVTPYTAPPGDFVTVNGRDFTLNGKPLYLRGFNYYPRHAPWEAFLTNADLAEIVQEFDLIAEAGFNSLRVALWYDPLFTCVPENAVPDAAGFAKLDGIIGLARERGLKLIVTLNDLPDLYYRPLYTDYARYDAQTAFIVSRYRNEPTILAWDLRNEPDLDYGADGRAAVASSEAVTKWLTHLAEFVRNNDPHHLITIGWWGDATASSKLVDFFSLHHWTDALALARCIETLRAASDKPILLEEVGYPAWDQDSEAQQAKSLQEVLDTAQRSGAAGWLIWTAFDFVPPPGQAPNQEYAFGLWRTDLTTKPALAILSRHVQP